jgi:hypothetical protein
MELNENVFIPRYAQFVNKLHLSTKRQHDYTQYFPNENIYFILISEWTLSKPTMYQIFTLKRDQPESL